jgi:1-deoxy-D-xylulose-5-phosphate synthase
MVIVLNDNGRSYAPTVSRLSSEVTRLRFSKRYEDYRRRIDALVEKVPYGRKVADAGLDAVKQVISQDPSLQHVVEALGVRYLGPVDGHDHDHLEEALRAARDHAEGPVLVHVLTQKGKGYTPAETDPEKKLHDTSAFDIATGRGVRSKPRSWTAAYSDALADLMDADERVVAMTAAMPGSTGLLPIAERLPDRVIDVGIAEQHMVTSAAGLAHEGRVPVVAVYSTFFSRAFDQANMDVGLHDEHVLFTFDRAGITGDDGPSHHGVLDMVLCLRIPTMTVFAPSSEQELVAQLATAARLSGPASLRWPKGSTVQAERVGEGLQALQHREGADVAIVAVGDRLWPALEAAETLTEDGIDCAVWDPRAVRPVDATMLDALAEAPVVVTVENGYVSGGAGAYIADRLIERTGVHDAPPVLRLGVPDTYISHAKPARILAELGLDAAGIDAAVRKVLGRA